jgi:hypothetical protein
MIWQRFATMHSQIADWIFYCFTGDPLYVGMDLTIASFDAISEVNMVSSIFVETFYDDAFKVYYQGAV